MTIQEEAKQYAEKLAKKFVGYGMMNESIAKYQCALECVQEILDPENHRIDCDIEFYKLVEQELIKMK
tara:strand:+ start:258 stop:461 length:204 start_codon:yes stop_codon:yes gene_type:complete